jgi:hypothetical protein
MERTQKLDSTNPRVKADGDTPCSGKLGIKPASAGPVSSQRKRWRVKSRLGKGEC